VTCHVAVCDANAVFEVVFRRVGSDALSAPVGYCHRHTYIRGAPAWPTYLIESITRIPNV